MKQTIKLRCPDTGQKYEVNLDITEKGILITDKDGTDMGNITCQALTNDDGTVQDVFYLNYGLSSITHWRAISHDMICNKNFITLGDAE